MPTGTVLASFGYHRLSRVPPMSFYRRLNVGRPLSDVYTKEPTKQEPGSPRAASQGIEDLKDYSLLRGAAPPNMPLPATLQWAATLPPSVHPTALLRQYGRIANVIAANWMNPGAFDAYMESLLTDKRGNRRGFPPDIVMELLALQRWNNTLRRGTRR